MGRTECRLRWPVVDHRPSFELWDIDSVYFALRCKWLNALLFVYMNIYIFISFTVVGGKGQALPHTHTTHNMLTVADSTSTWTVCLMMNGMVWLWLSLWAIAEKGCFLLFFFFSFFLAHFSGTSLSVFMRRLNETRAEFFWMLCHKNHQNFITEILYGYMLGYVYIWMIWGVIFVLFVWIWFFFVCAFFCLFFVLEVHTCLFCAAEWIFARCISKNSQLSLVNGKPIVFYRQLFIF